MKINFEKLQFTDTIRKMEKNDYEEAVRLAVKDLESNPDIVSVYLMNENWVPGISDIDMIAVCQNNVSERHPRLPKTLSEKAHYIFPHGYMHFNLESFKNIYYFFPNKFNLHHLAGPKIDLIEPSQEFSAKELNLLKASLILDFLTNKLLLLPHFLTRKIIETRKLILYIYTFIFTQEMIEEITGEKINNDFSEQIKNLRENWFSQKNEENYRNLSKAAENAFSLTVEILHQLDIFLRQSFGLVSFPQKLEFKSPLFHIVGVEKWVKEHFLREFSENYISRNPFTRKPLGHNKLLVPASFFSIFAIYSNSRGAYSSWFRKFLNPRSVFPRVKSAAIQKRMEVLNQFPLKKNGQVLYISPWHYGFFSTCYLKEVMKVKLLPLMKLLNIW